MDLKVLYACRLFTGLESILINQPPTGVPTIYKIIKELDKRCSEFRLVLTCKGQGKDTYTSWGEDVDVDVAVDELRKPVTVLCDWPKALPFKNHLREIRHTIRLLAEIKRFKPQLLYFDHANIWTAGLAARFLKIPTVLRIMGVYPAMRNALNKRRFVDRLLSWLYRSPFNLVICTQDGSDSSGWLQKALLPSVRRITMLNGVDRPRIAPKKAKGNVLFIGKLEAYKGCNEFVEAMLQLDLHAVIVGVGNQKTELVNRVNKAGATDRFTFIDRVPHDRIFELHSEADIYVSLNKYSALCNTNLEAMSAGSCMIALESDFDLGTDAVYRISRTNIIENLVTAIKHLQAHPEERARREKALARVANRIIPTWDARIRAELRLLETL